MRLKPVSGRVIISIDSEYKNSHTFSNGLKIRLEREWDNLNRREVAPVNAIVLEAENIPIGAEVIVHHNSNHPVHELFNYKKLDGLGIASNIKHYSIPETDCYLFRMGDKWLPCKGFATALRCYIPYSGVLENIKPTRLKSRLLITSGEFKDKVCIVEHGADYQMVFQGIDGREVNVIRLRHFEDIEAEREEIMAIDHFYTNEYLNGRLLVGLSAEHCELINIEYAGSIG